MDSYVLTTTNNVLGCTMKPTANSDRDTIFSWLIEHGYADEELETCTKLELLARVRKVHVVAKYEVLIFNANFYFLDLFYGIHIRIGEYNYV